LRLVVRVAELISRVTAWTRIAAIHGACRTTAWFDRCSVVWVDVPDAKEQPDQRAVAASELQGNVHPVQHIGAVTRRTCHE
jgi:hypothetical protein